MEGFFNVDRSNVISQKNYFIRVKLVTILMRQLSWSDKARFDQPYRERTRPRERIENVYLFILKSQAEMLSKCCIGTVQDEVNDLNRGIDNAQAFDHAWESRLEELIIQFNNDLLPPFGISDTRSSLSHTGIEPLQRLMFFVQCLFVENVHDLLHGA